MNDSGSEIHFLPLNSAIDQSPLLKVNDSSSQTLSVPSNSAVDQRHFLNLSSSDSKPDIKAADKKRNNTKCVCPRQFFPFSQSRWKTI